MSPASLETKFTSSPQAIFPNGFPFPHGTEPTPTPTVPKPAGTGNGLHKSIAELSSEATDTVGTAFVVGLVAFFAALAPLTNPDWFAPNIFAEVP